MRKKRLTKKQLVEEEHAQTLVQSGMRMMQMLPRTKMLKTHRLIVEMGNIMFEEGMAALDKLRDR